MSTFLLTRPEHDTTTYYLSHWCKEVISLAESKNIKVLDLNKEKANKKEFESKINTFCPKLIVLNGHGNDDVVTGHKNEPLIKVNSNDILLKNKIVYAISCRSAKSLGIEAIRKGALSYTGYDDDFIFVYESNKISKPLTDNTAKLFLEPSQLFVKSLLKNNSVEESLERAKEEMKNNLKKSFSEEEPSNSKYLWWNLKHMVSHGDPKSIFS